VSIGEIPLPWPAEINLSRPALLFLVETLGDSDGVYPNVDRRVQGELDNFRNLLQNLLERSEQPETGNFDLIGA